MLSRYAKAFFTRLLTPPARGLLAVGIGPDVVTWIGTIGVVAGAFAFYPRGDFFVGTVVITAFVFSDTLDGTMARLSGRSSRWGAFLDSTLDRVGDAAIFTRAAVVVRARRRAVAGRRDGRLPDRRRWSCPTPRPGPRAWA